MRSYEWKRLRREYPRAEKENESLADAVKAREQQEETDGKIQIKGPIVLDTDAWIYDWLGMPCACPKKLQKALEEANGEDVELEINSPGGYVSSGFEMYQAIKDYTGK